LISEY